MSGMSANSMSNSFIKICNSLCVLSLKLFHERDEGFDAFARESVVDGGTYAADRAVAFETVQPGGGCFFSKLLFQFLRRQAERDVHERARVRVGVAAIKRGRINRVVEYLRLRFILAQHPFKSAFFLQPFADEHDDVDAERVRRVIERLGFDVRAVVEHRVQMVWNARQQIVAQDDERDAARPHVLLRSGIDERVFFDRDGTRKNVGRSITDERHIARVRLCFPFHTFNRLV
jgi:hypothetical protein